QGPEHTSGGVFNFAKKTREKMNKLHLRSGSRNSGRRLSVSPKFPTRVPRVKCLVVEHSTTSRELRVKSGGVL
ncbi:hypothetical protein LCGC14_2813070, partial [marine sediment metagenome]